MSLHHRQWGCLVNGFMVKAGIVPTDAQNSDAFFAITGQMIGAVVRDRFVQGPIFLFVAELSRADERLQAEVSKSGLREVKRCVEFAFRRASVAHCIQGTCSEWPSACLGLIHRLVGKSKGS